MTSLPTAPSQPRMVPRSYIIMTYEATNLHDLGKTRRANLWSYIFIGLCGGGQLILPWCNKLVQPKSVATASPIDGPTDAVPNRERPSRQDRVVASEWDRPSSSCRIRDDQYVLASGNARAACQRGGHSGMPPEAGQAPNARQDSVGAVQEAHFGGERTARTRAREVAVLVPEGSRVDRGQGVGEEMRTDQDSKKGAQRRVVGVISSQQTAVRRNPRRRDGSLVAGHVAS